MKKVRGTKKAKVGQAGKKVCAVVWFTPILQPQIGIHCLKETSTVTTN